MTFDEWWFRDTQLDGIHHDACELAFIAGAASAAPVMSDTRALELACDELVRISDCNADQCKHKGDEISCKACWLAYLREAAKP